MNYKVFVPKPELIEQQTDVLGRGAAIVAPIRARIHDGMIDVVVLQPHDRRERYADTIRRALKQGRRHELPLDTLFEAGIFDDHAGELKMLPGRDRAIGGWIGQPVHRGVLECTDSRQAVRGQARRDMRNAMMRGDVASAARIMNEHHLPGW